MRKRSVIVIAVIVCLCGIALAGTITQLVCDKCKFESNDLFEGSGIDGSMRTIVYCEACKNFYTIPTASFRSGRDSRVQEPIGKKEFFGQERQVYRCPQCIALTVRYDGPTCPLCSKGILRKTSVGMWD